MTQPDLPPNWAKLYKVSEVVRLDESEKSRRTWFQYTLVSEHSKIVGKRFGASKEIWEHANDRAMGLNERLLGKRAKSLYARKKG